MSRPRVFVSSTYYDLKHLRSSLENFVESLGFDAILSEKGKIAYTPDLPLDESCYREVSTVDVFVLIIGGRYGSEVSATKTSVPKTFYDRYNSVTRGEFRSAVEREIPTYVLIERAVYAEYETYLKNKDNKGVVYAHVDSVNIFELIEDILTQPRNNPIQQFDKYSEIETWLREQWSGLFRELLQRIRGQAQIASLQSQVAQLSELNTTFKRYLEEIVSKIAPQESKTIIKTETKRLEEASNERLAQTNSMARYIVEMGVPFKTIRRSAETAESVEDFLRNLFAGLPVDVKQRLSNLKGARIRSRVFEDLNRLRESLGTPRLPVPSDLSASPVTGVGDSRNESLKKSSKRPNRRRKKKES